MTTKKTTDRGCFIGRNKVSLKQTNKSLFGAILIVKIRLFLWSCFLWKVLFN